MHFPPQRIYPERVVSNVPIPHVCPEFTPPFRVDREWGTSNLGLNDFIRLKEREIGGSLKSIGKWGFSAEVHGGTFFQFTCGASGPAFH